MKDYIHANMAAYENTAEEFQAKKSIRLKADKHIADIFSSHLKKDGRVLELGTGSGQLSKLLCEQGLKVDAIEYAPKMAQLAALTAPDANIIADEFMGHDFGVTKYDGIIGIAFVHLFNAEDAKEVMTKLNALLVDGGVLMLATTIHDKTFDDIVKKSNFKTEAYRFRRHYSLKDFESLFTDAGFTLKSTVIEPDGEVEGKEWVNVTAIKA